MDVEFFIGLDPTYNRRLSSDLDSGPSMRKAYSTKLEPGAVAKRFSVELGRAQTLLLAVLPHVIKVGDKDRCWFPHVVVARPRLTKE